jgi:pentatricopeptide repeat protein
MGACVDGGRSAKAFEVYSSMQVRGEKANGETFNVLIRACQAEGDWKRAISIMVDMRLSGVDPQTESYNGLIGACIKGGESARAVGVYEAMRKAGQARPDVHTYNTVIELFCSLDKLDEALKVVDEMKSKNVAPDAKTIELLFSRRSPPPEATPSEEEVEEGETSVDGPHP